MKKSVTNIVKNAACTMMIASLFLPSYAAAEASDMKTTPITSFFARFINKKPTKKTENSETNVAVIKGGVTLSMEDCVGIAMKNDPDVKNAKDTQQAQKNAVGIAKSSYFPRITGSTGYNINNMRYSDIGSVNANNYGVNVGVNQLIWDFGYTQANINMNKYDL